MKPQSLSIQSEVFFDLRDRFDKALEIALRKMKDLKITAGTVTAEVDIVLEEGTDGNGDTLLLPEFSAQVKINLPMKGKLDVPTKKGFIMARDPTGEGFIIASGQYTFMDLLEEQENGE